VVAIDTGAVREHSMVLQRIIPRWKLTVVSRFGGVEIGNPQGAGEYLEGTQAAWSVSSPWPSAFGENGTRCVADSAGGTVLMATDQTVEVTWKRQFAVNLGVVGNGTVTPAAPAVLWYASGQQVTLTATPRSARQRFVCWQTGPTGQPKTENPLTLTIDRAWAVTAAFELVAAEQELVTVDLVLAKGWNLVSVPLWLQTPNVVELFGAQAGSAVWTWVPGSGCYRRVWQIEPKQGFWVYSAKAQTVRLCGVPETDASLALASGWNLVGPVASGQLPQDPQIEGKIKSWDAAGHTYTDAASFETMRGYWIRCK
jgi:hypothetical protein